MEGGVMPAQSDVGPAVAAAQSSDCAQRDRHIVEVEAEPDECRTLEGDPLDKGVDVETFVRGVDEAAAMSGGGHGGGQISQAEVLALSRGCGVRGAHIGEHHVRHGPVSSIWATNRSPIAAIDGGGKRRTSRPKRRRVGANWRKRPDA